MPLGDCRKKLNKYTLIFSKLDGINKYVPNNHILYFYHA